MKKLALLILLSLITVSTGQAENIKGEAIDSLTTARTFVEKGNYSKAIEEIDYAMAKINELTATSLIKFIPDPPAGYTLDSKQSQGLGAGASIAGNAGANAAYSNSSGAHINLNIAIGGMTGKMAGLAAFGQMFAGLAAQTGSEAQSKKIRIQGYTGTQIYERQGMSGTVTFQIGEKTSVTIEGDNIESADILKELAKKIDFSGLEENY